MKGLSGLVIAAILGVLGAGINMVYLHNKTKSIDMVLFVGVRSGHTIHTGDIIRKEDLEPVPVPLSRAHTLRQYAFLWDDVNTVAGIAATRNYQGGELVFLSDYRTPPPELHLEPDEVLLPIEVANRSTLIEPGDRVSFLVPTTDYRPEPPEDPMGELAGVEPAPVPTGALKMYGPFRVGAIGNRISSQDVMKAYRIPQLNQNQLGIIVKQEGNQLEARAMTLLTALQNVSSRSVRVVLHSRQSKR